MPKSHILALLSALALWACSGQTSMSSAARKEKKEADVDPDAKRAAATDQDGRRKGDSDVDGGDGKRDTNLDAAAAESLPKFAMMANHFDCGFCHTKVLGDIGSTADVPPARNDSKATIVGDWYARGTINVTGNGAAIDITGARRESYAGKKIPSSFPALDFDDVKSGVEGKLKVSGSAHYNGTIKKRHSGNVILVGSDESPLEIDGDVFIDGDVVILGRFRGIGTIYASGVIAIPADLKAKRSPFPYPEDREDAAERARAAAKNDGFDGLGLASAKSIFIGDLDTTIIGDANAPVNTRPDVQALYAWATKPTIVSLYGMGADCVSGAATHRRSLELVDAFLYARRSIEGKVTGTSASIRGGFVTDYYNVLSGAPNCRGNQRVSAAHGHPADSFYIEYDWRLQTGRYPVLQHLGKAIKDLSE